MQFAHLTRKGYITRACAQLSLRIEERGRGRATSISTTSHECVRRGVTRSFSARFACTVYLASAPLSLTLRLPLFRASTLPFFTVRAWRRHSDIGSSPRHASDAPSHNARRVANGPITPQKQISFLNPTHETSPRRIRASVTGHSMSKNRFLADAPT